MQIVINENQGQNTCMIPLWFTLALGSSVSAALGMYMHQRLNGSTFASCVWLKILAVIIATPVLIKSGLPESPTFYTATAGAALIWCVNDIIYFRNVTTHGAALLSRLAPIGIILAFVVWFFIKPELLGKYLEDPVRFALVCLTLAFAVLCSVLLRHCPVSWKALKSIWFVLLAVPAGSILMKIAADHAPKAQGVFGYVGLEAALMLCFYAVILTFTRRTAVKEIFSFQGLKTGGIIGALLIVGIILRTSAYQHVDHPAFVIMISMLDVVWLMILTRLSGWKDNSDKIAGLGIVIAALCLAILKIR